MKSLILIITAFSISQIALASNPEINLIGQPAQDLFEAMEEQVLPYGLQEVIKKELPGLSCQSKQEWWEFSPLYQCRVEKNLTQKEIEKIYQSLDAQVFSRDSSNKDWTVKFKYFGSVVFERFENVNGRVAWAVRRVAGRPGATVQIRGVAAFAIFQAIKVVRLAKQSGPNQFTVGPLTCGLDDEFYYCSLTGELID